MDAGGTGTTLGPEEATRFARGEEVVATSGQPVRLGQPLDWVAITDHSDMMGMITEIKGGNPEMMADPTLKRWRDMFNGGPVEAKKGVMELVAAQSGKKLPPAATDPKFAKSVWAKNTAIAEKYNEPGRFTAFIGYEWTSNAGGGDNLHRNIIYRDNKDKADQVLPYTTFQSENPEDLYKWMTEWEKTTGGKLLAIAHNGNLSNGRMFAMTTFSGDPMTKAWAEARQRWEPLFEAVQMKGQSESHPSLSTTDDFAAWELWDRGNLTQTPKKPGMIQDEYVREALKNGLKVEQDLGTNPFKFGMAARDRHPQRPRGGRRGQLLRQIPQCRAEGGSVGRGRDELRPRPHREGLGDDGGGIHRRVGDRQHACGAVGRDDAPRDLRDERSAHDRPVVRRLRLHAG